MPQPDFSMPPPDELAAFFAPRAVAVFGASRDRHKLGSEILHNLMATGFTGPIYPIHPSATEIQGRRAFPSLAEVGGEVDLAVIVVPAAHVSGVVDQCIEAGVCALCIISAGFGECTAEGKRLEQQI